MGLPLNAFDKTSIEEMVEAEHRSLCLLVWKLFPQLVWRHNGIGCLQAYIKEGETDEARVHIWHPSLRTEGIENSGLIHDHRFDLTSQILVGTIAQYEYDLFEDEFGVYQTHTVVHAREAMASSESFDGKVTALPTRYHANIHSIPIDAGSTYTFPKRLFHKSNVKGLAVTLVTKSKQDPEPARILAPYGSPVVHAFAASLPESAWQIPIEEARAALLKMWEMLK